MSGEPVLDDAQTDTLLVKSDHGRLDRPQRSTSRSAARTPGRGWSSTTGRTACRTRSRSHASQRPELVARALSALRHARGFAA